MCNSRADDWVRKFADEKSRSGSPLVFSVKDFLCGLSVLCLASFSRFNTDATKNTEQNDRERQVTHPKCWRLSTRRGKLPAEYPRGQRASCVFFLLFVSPGACASASCRRHSTWLDHSSES